MDERKPSNEVPSRLFLDMHTEQNPSVDMEQIVGKQDILFICLDTLRYDAAAAEEKAQGTPVLNQFGPWEKRQAPGLQAFCLAVLTPRAWQNGKCSFSPNPLVWETRLQRELLLMREAPL